MSGAHGLCLQPIFLLSFSVKLKQRIVFLNYMVRILLLQNIEHVKHFKCWFLANCIKYVEEWKM